jgi:hypothetical protein
MGKLYLNTKLAYPIQTTTNRMEIMETISQLSHQKWNTCFEEETGTLHSPAL